MPLSGSMRKCAWRRADGKMDVTTGKNKDVTTPRKRNVPLNLRVTPGEKKEIECCAAALGMTQTELVMNGVHIIDGMIKKHKEKQAEAGKEQAV